MSNRERVDPEFALQDAIGKLMCDPTASAAFMHGMAAGRDASEYNVELWQQGMEEPGLWNDAELAVYAPCRLDAESLRSLKTRPDDFTFGAMVAAYLYRKNPDQPIIGEDDLHVTRKYKQHPIVQE